MALDIIETPVALVVVDLQLGITRLPAAHPLGPVIDTTRRLADRVRDGGGTVIWVTIDFSPDGRDASRCRTDVPAPPPPPYPPEFAALEPGLGFQPLDVHVRKRAWNSFHGTDLDLQLRRRGVRTVILTGVATSIGVESTARDAFDRDYDVILASDAMTDPIAAAHDHSLTLIAPRLGRVATAAEIIEALSRN